MLMKNLRIKISHKNENQVFQKKKFLVKEEYVLLA
jgi:hypothetical protein